MIDMNRCGNGDIELTLNTGKTIRYVKIADCDKTDCWEVYLSLPSIRTVNALLIYLDNDVLESEVIEFGKTLLKAQQVGLSNETNL